MAKLKVRGLGWVEGIPDEIVKSIRELWRDKTVDRKTEVDAAGVWSGVLSDISSFFIEPPSRADAEDSYNFSEEDFRKADLDMNELKGMGFTGKHLILRWLEKQGGCKIVTEKDWKGDDYHSEVVTNPSAYARSSHLLSDYFDWKGRKEYGQKMRMQELDQVAAGGGEEMIDNPFGL